MLTKICGRCGRVIKQGTQCPCEAERQREYDCEHRNRESASFYHSKSWKLLQQAVASRAGYTDEYLRYYKGRIQQGRIAHHIAPVDERPDLRLDGRNIIYVSDKTHQMIHAEYGKGEREKREMMMRLYRIRMDAEENLMARGGQKSFGSKNIEPRGLFSCEETPKNMRGGLRNGTT